MLLLPVRLLLLTALLVGGPRLGAQVHYHPSGAPWNQKARSGPDAVVDGWFYNLGITGLRVVLMEDEPAHLLVKHVLAGSPAADRVRPGDVIVGIEGEELTEKHRNGYGMDRFGAHGPIGAIADALEAAQDRSAGGRLRLTLRREGKVGDVTLKVGTDHGRFAPTWPADCEKSARLLEELCRYLVAHQGEDGSWGSPVQDTFAPLALLATGDRRFAKAVQRNVRFHARTTHAEDDSWLINWRYAAAGIVLAEYELATEEKWVRPELEEVRDFLLSSQYLEASQIDPETRKKRARDLPKSPLDSHGGWGHNPGFEGYGPISMLTGQAALALALMHRCGLEIDRERHDAAYAFLDRGTGENGYVWYEDEVAGDERWADMGRTGAAGLANLLAPYEETIYRERALAHARCIGDHPESFPDTHGSPVMGMAYSALAAHADPESFRALLDANRWWFVLARCGDGSFYYQPNRDNAGYGADSRVKPTAAVALILAAPRRSLALTGARRDR